MKVGKFRVIALCCLLLLNGAACSYLSGDNTSPTPTPTPEATSQLTVTQAKENLRIAENDLEKAQKQSKDVEKAKADAAALRKAADAAKEEAGRLKAQAIRNGRDPNNPQDAPQTYAATQAWQAAEAKAVDAEQDLLDLPGAVARATTRVEKARQALQEAQPHPTATTVQSPAEVTPATGGNPGLPLWLPILLSLLLLFVVAEGFLGFLLFRSVVDNLKAIESSLASTEKRLESLSTKQAELPGALNAQSGNLQPISVELSRLQTTVGKMEAVLTATAHTVQNIRQSLPGVPQQQQHYADDVSVTMPVPRSSVVEFPITAEDYQNRVASDLVPVSHNYLKKMLVRVDDDEGVMFVVEDGSAPDNMNFVVPQLKRFQAKGDFMPYSDYFDCPNPAAGEITIISPALVYRASSGGGWLLHKRGELKV
jgi:hypothetical protein